jgi:hypothetical protein
MLSLKVFSFFLLISIKVYGNWLYDVMTLVFLPSWLLFWVVLFPNNEVGKKKLKKN